MRKIWLYALPLALAALQPVYANAGGRGGENAAVALVAEAPGGPDLNEGGVGTYTYNDVMKPHDRARGEAAEQAATRICDAGNPDNISTKRFTACMQHRGWRFVQFTPAAPDASDGDSSPSFDSSPAASDNSGSDAAEQAIEMANQQAANDAATAAAEQQNNDAMLAAQQTMNNANQ
jgi:hypothetical protein